MSITLLSFTWSDRNADTTLAQCKGRAKLFHQHRRHFSDSFAFPEALGSAFPRHAKLHLPGALVGHSWRANPGRCAGGVLGRCGATTGLFVGQADFARREYTWSRARPFAAAESLVGLIKCLLPAFWRLWSVQQFWLPARRGNCRLQPQAGVHPRTAVSGWPELGGPKPTRSGGQSAQGAL